MNRLIEQKTIMVGLLATLAAPVHAEVMVLLPTDGPLALAAQSVSDGLMAGYYAGNTRPALRFVNDDHTPIDQLMKREMRKDTELVIGPLHRDRVKELVELNLPVPVLALNQVSANQAGVWEFALAPEEDANALIRRMQADGIKKITLVSEPEQQSNRRFEQVFEAAWQGELTRQKQIPATLADNEGVLLLGQASWQRQLDNLPKTRTYTTAWAYSAKTRLPSGMTFCDIPALYRPEWPELVAEQKRKPVSVGYQRLVAFGGDAWQLARLMLMKAPSAQFAGRTGTLKLANQQIERQPDCMVVSGRKLKLLP